MNKGNLKILWLLCAMALLTLSCSEGLGNLQETVYSTNQTTQTVTVAKGNLLVIDEANQVLNAVDMANGSIKQISYVGNAANDIKIQNDFAYVIASLNHTIFKIDLKNGGSLKTYKFSGSPNPYNMALDGEYIYVSQNVSNSVTVIKSSDMVLVTNVSLSTLGYPLGIASDSNFIYVATSAGYVGWGNEDNYTNSRIAVIAKSNYSLVTNIPVNKNPQSLCIAGNTLFVATSGNYDGSGKIQKLDLSADYALSDLSAIVSPTASYIKTDAESLYIIDGTFGSSKFIIATLAGNTVTNLLNGINLKGLDFNSEFIILSEGYAGNACYRIDKNTYQVTTYTNTGGGDMALYQ